MAAPSPPGPSVAVLPFANMSGDKARTSAFAFKGQNTDVRHIAERLSEYFFSVLSGALVIAPAPDAEQSARTAALRAVELDPLCDEAHAVLCGMAAEFDHDWIEAERRFVLATSGDTVPAEARRMCGFNCFLAAG